MLAFNPDGSTYFSLICPWIVVFFLLQNTASLANAFNNLLFQDLNIQIIINIHLNSVNIINKYVISMCLKTLLSLPERLDRLHCWTVCWRGIDANEKKRIIC